MKVVSFDTIMSFKNSIMHEYLYKKVDPEVIRGLHNYLISMNGTEWTSIAAVLIQIELRGA